VFLLDVLDAWHLSRVPCCLLVKMNFAIEVPAEANPLTTQTLFHVLQSASSNDQQQVKTGTQQLQHWEVSPGFFSLLQSIYLDYALPVELRTYFETSLVKSVP